MKFLRLTFALIFFWVHDVIYHSSTTLQQFNKTVRRQPANEVRDRWYEGQGMMA